MSISPPPSYDSCQAPPLPPNSSLQTLNYDPQSHQNHVNNNNINNNSNNNNAGERKGGPTPPPPPAIPNPMILPPSVPPGGVENPMLPPYPYPPTAPPYYNYNVGYYGGGNGGGPLGGIPGEPPFCQGLRAGNGRMTPQGGRYYVNSSGFIEHLTAEQYQNRRVIQAVATVCAVILMIVIFFIAFRNMHYR